MTAYRQARATALYKEISVNGQRMYEHRYVAAIKIGRALRSDEEVHHIDGDGWNNHPDNLEVMSRKEHVQRHPQAAWVKEAKELGEKGWTVRQISTKLGVTYRNVWRVLKWHGVKTRRDDTRPSPVDIPKAARLLKAGHSLRSIGRVVGHNHQTVAFALRRAGFM